MSKIHIFIADDAVTKHDGCEDMDIYDPGKVDLHVYPADSDECKSMVAYYYGAFPDVEDFFGEREIQLLAKKGWHVLKVGYDEKTERFIAMLGNRIEDECSEFRIIWFDGSHDQFLIRSAQINGFYDHANEYFERMQ